LRLKKNYQGVKTEKLRSLQEFERKSNESSQRIHSYATINCSYLRGDGGSGSPILVWDSRQGVAMESTRCDDSPTLAHVFFLSEKIELNMVEERVVTSRFNRYIVTISRGQQSTSQPHTGGGGSGGGQVQPQSGSRGMSAQRPLPSFVSQQQGQSCWTCGGAHIRRDCPQESGGRTLANGF
jgi:hypothetical protein